MLTPKQEKFCQCIVSGKSGIDSYIESYNCNSRNAAGIESMKLLKRDDITERITELRKPIINLVQNTTLTERQNAINFIQERIQVCIDNNDESSVIRYRDQLNKILGLYSESQDEKPNDNPIQNIDLDALKRLTTA